MDNRTLTQAELIEDAVVIYGKKEDGTFGDVKGTFAEDSDGTYRRNLPTAEEAETSRRAIQNSEFKGLLEDAVKQSIDYQHKISTAKTGLKRDIYKKKLEKNNIKVAKIANLINLTNKLYDAGWNGEM